MRAMDKGTRIRGSGFIPECRMRNAEFWTLWKNAPNSELRTVSFSKAGVGKRFIDIFYLKSDCMKLVDIFACRNELPGIDGKSFSNPIHISTGESWRLMDMAMKR